MSASTHNGFTKKDIRNLVLIWILGTGFAVLTAFASLALYNPELLNPTRDMATTHWLSAPVTPIAEAVRVNWAFTIAIIFPFLFCPIMTLVYCMVKFTEKKNKQPSHIHENVPLEIFWTIIPAVVLVVMAVPSYAILKQLENPPAKPDVVVEVVGAQYYWQYYFPKYDVGMTDDGTGDSPVYFPKNKIVQLNGTSNQVNHAWWVPAFGIKFDVIPGRINSGWVKSRHTGYFKGQCAELCGALHAFMWIHVKVVEEAEFYQWVIDNEGTIPFDEIEKVRALLGDEAVAPFEIDETEEVEA
ncbi:MAG: cytochrome c oxidase subunit II [Candidatus Sumerlaeia bacterium]|nr:cytochrome c oxidase subunit II [Candidatus Sumerlaeia bacterium]